ncbi:MAG TPA: insulinase family protein, partial [Acidobacteriota bacterium]|nr:insulinase family protein [Acidobacteriota bacterium]
PDLISRTTASDIKRVAEKYFQPYQRTIGWYLGDGKNISQATNTLNRFAKGKSLESQAAQQKSTRTQHRTRTLKNGITLIVQKSTRSPAVFFRAVIPSNQIEPATSYSSNDPLWGYTSVTRKFLKKDLATVIPEMRKVFDGSFPTVDPDPGNQDDPEFRLNSTLEEMLALKKRSGKNTPTVIVLVGDIDEENALTMLANAFSDLKYALRPQKSNFNITEREKTIRIPGKAQSQLGYAVPAASPSDPSVYAWKMLRYIMSHDYEGRLGIELIAKQGLLYGFSSGYTSDGDKGWVYITTGVNPDKLSAVKQRFQEIMRGLVSNPPSSAEIAEAKNHLIGRRKTAYQSNQEISGFLATEWIENGKVLSQEEFEHRINSVSEQAVRNIVPSFLAGVTAIIDCSL